ncbi:hypothetical protein RI129_007073 [Pyrocoelia pectoralis]|uniref:Methyltransferase type 11 domain-containing protein n=1 Tax=Pyrocoelia pectoralis TaxID=417401 RepID=A0AAN7VAF8_9COLE
MNQALLYSKYNGLQKSDATYVLDNYIDLIKWKKDANILDVGCGAGDVISELLLPRLPLKFEKLVGVDLSEEMIEFAKNHCQNSKITFEQMNIATDDIPVEFEENFDHILSFYCLHWVQDQRKALLNIYKMLKEGGDVLLTFLANNPIFEIYQSLSKKGRWESYMENVKNYVSPYQYSENPDKQLEEVLIDVGFDIDVCKTEDRIYVYPNVAVLKKSITAVSPFYSQIPSKMQEDYLSDCMKEVKKLNLFDHCDNNNQQSVQVPYKLFVVHARKYSE